MLAHHRRRGRTAAVLLALLGMAGGLLAFLYHTAFALPLPPLRAAHPGALDLASRVYAADGQELARYYRQNRTWVGADQIAAPVVAALLATEDHRFYSHRGIDFVRLGRAAVQTLRGDRQGASTLTMQLARNLHPEIGRAVSLRRKLREAVTALTLERRYDKQTLLEMYLNTMSFGNNAFGIEAAAQTYFSKPAARLDVLESALLVGLLKGPTRYNPLRHPDRARSRRNVVLGQMARRGLLAPAEAARLRREPLHLEVRPPSLASRLAPHFAEHVRAEAEAWAARHGYDLYTDGLRIYTTLDPQLQASAVAAVAEQMAGLQAVVGYEWSRASSTVLGDDPAPYRQREAAGRFSPFAYLWQHRPDLLDAAIRQAARYRRAVRAGADPAATLARLRRDEAFTDSLKAARTRLEVGLIALDPHTGRVRAWVGGRDFAQDQYDHVALARRQPGSTFKPFLFAAAVDRGYAPGSLLPVSTDSVTLRDGLAYSRNTVAARLVADLGPFAVARMARRLGVRSPLTLVPSLALGTSEVTLLEMASAYATLAQHGRYHAPQVIERIEDRQGRVLASFAPTGRKVLSMYTAHTVLDMMRGVVDRGTGTDLRRRFGVRADVAGKTGTTQHNADGWFILAHPNLVAGAWVGFNDPRIRFRTDYWGQGGHNALRVVGDFFARAVREGNVRDPEATFEPPPGYREPEPLLAAGFAAPEDLDTYLRLPAAVARPRPSLPADAMARLDADVEQALRGATAALPGAGTARPGSASEDALARQDADAEQALRRAYRHEHTPH